MLPVNLARVFQVHQVLQDSQAHQGLKDSLVRYAVVCYTHASTCADKMPLWSRVDNLVLMLHSVSYDTAAADVYMTRCNCTYFTPERDVK